MAMRRVLHNLIRDKRINQAIPFMKIISLPLLKLVGYSALCAVLAFIVWLAWFAFMPLTLKTSPLEFEIHGGASVRTAAQEMNHAGVEFEPWQFILLARALGHSGDIKAGSYEVESGISPFELLNKLTRGDVSQTDFMIVEGWNFRQVRAQLNADANLNHDSQALTNAEIMRRIGADGESPEGQFFPETYSFPKGYSDLALLRRARDNMLKKMAAEWAERAPDLPYTTPYQALIMASIIEKETGQATERANVASVFINRLRLGMPLQTDPTIIFGLGEKFDGNIRKRDLTTDGQFNTYTRTGLPPTPVAMPGRECIHAALHPATTNYLYFVARGDGSSEFSSNLIDHNRAVAKYIKRKQIP